MKIIAKLVAFTLYLFLTGCWGESLCDAYHQIPALDRNLDGEEDYLYQVIGDSILAYHQINCKSVGHHFGFEMNQRAQTYALTGAKLHEIAEQYQPPADPESDYDYVIINGGLNDILAGSPVAGSDTAPCDCNGAVNHDACVAKIAELQQDMAVLIENIHQTSTANVALVTYYPAETTDSFIGACFPYVERLNDAYRWLAQQDDRVSVIETYGADQDVIQKVNVFGRDNYHPAPGGSQQIAGQLVEQLGLSIPQEPVLD